MDERFAVIGYTFIETGMVIAVWSGILFMSYVSVKAHIFCTRCVPVSDLLASDSSEAYTFTQKKVKDVYLFYPRVCSFYIFLMLQPTIVFV